MYQQKACQTEIGQIIPFFQIVTQGLDFVAGVPVKALTPGLILPFEQTLTALTPGLQNTTPNPANAHQCLDSETGAFYSRS